MSRKIFENFEIFKKAERKLQKGGNPQNETYFTSADVTGPIKKCVVVCSGLRSGTRSWRFTGIMQISPRTVFEVFY
jgi:hypothetical protein